MGAIVFFCFTRFLIEKFLHFIWSGTEFFRFFYFFSKIFCFMAKKKTFIFIHVDEFFSFVFYYCINFLMAQWISFTEILFDNLFLFFPVNLFLLLLPIFLLKLLFIILFNRIFIFCGPLFVDIVPM